MFCSNLAAKQEASEASTRITQSTMEKKHAEERLRALVRDFKTSSEQFQRDQELISRQQEELDKLQVHLIIVPPQNIIIYSTA